MEPTREAFAGDAFGLLVKRHLLATRPMFLSASLLPVVVGTSWGVLLAGGLDWPVLVLALLSIACLHAGANVLNDVYDDLSGTDRANDSRIFPYTGGSRFIQNQVMSVAQMRRWGIVLLLMAAGFGGILIIIKGIGVLVLGLLGLGLGIAYSMPPLQLASRGLGETAVALGFGVLPVTGSAWLQSDMIDSGAILLAAPVSLWVANILLANEVPDIRADAAAGKATLAVRLGRARSERLALALQLAALLTLGVAAMLTVFSPWSLTVPLLLFGRQLVRSVKAGPDGDAKGLIRDSLLIHGVGSLWLASIVWL